MSGKDHAISHLPPPGGKLSLYNPSQLPTSQSSPTIPSLFQDAMTVRETVFCQEQHIELANEFDRDDPRSHHWVLYTSTSSTAAASAAADRTPVGTIRLVPPPHAPHHAATGDEGDGGDEPFIKLGRLAVLPAYRKGGFAGRLLVTALEFARNQAGLLADDRGREWRGRVLVHAQIGMERYYEKWGFERDAGMGVWDEEGIDHIGMWRTLELRT